MSDVEEIKFGEYLILKVKLPTYDMFYAPHYKINNQSSEGDPLIINVGEKSKKHIDGNVLFLYTNGRYFHDFFENFDKILLLKNKGEKFKVGFVSEVDVAEDGYFKGMFSESDEGFSQRVSYFKEFLDYFDIEMFCISDRDVKNVSCDYGYVFYFKTNKNSIDDHLYKVLSKHEEIEKEYIEPKEISVGFPYYRASHSQAHTYKTTIDCITILKNSFIRNEKIGRKVYVTRKNFPDRKFNQENTLEKYFEEKGFEIINFENFNVFDQIKIVQQSSHIAMLAGGGLSNVTLANKGTKVLMLCPDNGYEVIDFYIGIYDYFKIIHYKADIPNDVIGIIDKLSKNQDFFLD